MSKKFRHDGKQVTATNMGPDVTVMATGGALPQSTRDVIQFEDPDGTLRTAPFPKDKFNTLTKLELRNLYKKAIPEF